MAGVGWNGGGCGCSRAQVNWRMPRPSPIAPEPEPRKPPQKVAPTPEQIAKIVTAKLASPVGMPDKAEVPLNLVLPRDVIASLRRRRQAGVIARRCPARAYLAGRLASGAVVRAVASVVSSSINAWACSGFVR